VRPMATLGDRKQEAPVRASIDPFPLAHADAAPFARTQAMTFQRRARSRTTSLFGLESHRVGLSQDHSDVLSYSLDCQGIECLLPLSGQVLSLEDERDVLAIKNGAASGARRSSEVRARAATRPEFTVASVVRQPWLRTSTVARSAWSTHTRSSARRRTAWCRFPTR